MTFTSEDELREQCQMMARSISEGSVVPFFGAGVNLANRPPHEGSKIGKYLPDNDELSKIIADRFVYPWEDSKNLPRVSWYATAKHHRTVSQYLHNIFSAKYSPTEVHEFFARLPGTLLKMGYRNRYQLIVTTNYDEVLEQAFDAEDEPYDVLAYVAHSHDKREVGKFRYIPHGGKQQVILEPTKFLLPINDDGFLERTIILKIHGAIDKFDWHRSSFVVTEDDYVDYLEKMNTSAYDIPSCLLTKLNDSNFLFLGYSLTDWNIRVRLHRIRSNQTHSDTSWAVMHETEDWDEMYWQEHQVEFMKYSLSKFVAVLNEEIDALTDFNVDLSV